MLDCDLEVYPIQYRTYVGLKMLDMLDMLDVSRYLGIPIVRIFSDSRSPSHRSNTIQPLGASGRYGHWSVEKNQKFMGQIPGAPMHGKYGDF